MLLICSIRNEVVALVDGASLIHPTTHYFFLPNVYWHIKYISNSDEMELIRWLPEKNLPDCAGFLFVFKAQQQAQSGLCNWCCNAEDGQIYQQGGKFFDRNHLKARSVSLKQESNPPKVKKTNWLLLVQSFGIGIAVGLTVLQTLFTGTGCLRWSSVEITWLSVAVFLWSSYL